MAKRKPNLANKPEDQWTVKEWEENKSGNEMVAKLIELGALKTAHSRNPKKKVLAGRVVEAIQKRKKESGGGDDGGSAQGSPQQKFGVELSDTECDSDDELETPTTAQKTSSVPRPGEIVYDREKLASVCSIFSTPGQKQPATVPTAPTTSSNAGNGSPEKKPRAALGSPAHTLPTAPSNPPPPIGVPLPGSASLPKELTALAGNGSTSSPANKPRSTFPPLFNLLSTAETKLPPTFQAPLPGISSLSKEPTSSAGEVISPATKPRAASQAAAQPPSTAPVNRPSLSQAPPRSSVAQEPVNTSALAAQTPAPVEPRKQSGIAAALGPLTTPPTQQGSPSLIATGNTAPGAGKNAAAPPSTSGRGATEHVDFTYHMMTRLKGTGVQVDACALCKWYKALAGVSKEDRTSQWIKHCSQPGHQTKLESESACEEALEYVQEFKRRSKKAPSQVEKNIKTPAPPKASRDGTGPTGPAGSFYHDEVLGQSVMRDGKGGLTTADGTSVVDLTNDKPSTFQPPSTVHRSITSSETEEQSRRKRKKIKHEDTGSLELKGKDGIKKADGAQGSDPLSTEKDKKQQTGEDIGSGKGKKPKGSTGKAPATTPVKAEKGKDILSEAGSYQVSANLVNLLLSRAEVRGTDEMGVVRGDGNSASKLNALLQLSDKLQLAVSRDEDILREMKDDPFSSNKREEQKCEKRIAQGRQILRLIQEEFGKED